MVSLKEEVLKYLRKDEKQDGRFLLTKEHLFYLTDEQSDYYLKMMDDPNYSSSFHGPTVQIIESNVEDMFAGSGNEVSLIDLGPGFPDKALPMAKHLKECGVSLDYYPVDISSKYLEISAREMKPFSKTVTPINAMFESCGEQLPTSLYDKTTYCMIGLTFMNFTPTELIPILKNIATKKGSVIVASELITETNTIDKITSSYKNEMAQKIGFAPLRIIGQDPSSAEFHVEFNNSRVEFVFELTKEPSEMLYKAGVKKRDQIVTCLSYRYTSKQLEDLLNKNFESHKTYLSKDGSTAVAVCKQ